MKSWYCDKCATRYQGTINHCPNCFAPNPQPSRTTPASDFAKKAIILLDGDRQQTHGEKRQNHENIASLWSAYLARLLDKPVTLKPEHVALMMVLLKVGRTLAGVYNPDDYVDAIGYAAIAGQLSETDRVNEPEKP